MVSQLDSQQRQVEILLGPEMLGDDLPSDRPPCPVNIDRLVGPGGLDHVRTGQYQPRRHEEAGPLIRAPGNVSRTVQRVSWLYSLVWSMGPPLGRVTWTWSLAAPLQGQLQVGRARTLDQQRRQVARLQANLQA